MEKKSEKSEKSASIQLMAVKDCQIYGAFRWTNTKDDKSGHLFHRGSEVFSRDEFVTLFGERQEVHIGQLKSCWEDTLGRMWCRVAWLATHKQSGCNCQGKLHDSKQEVFRTKYEDEALVLAVRSKCVVYSRDEWEKLKRNNPGRRLGKEEYLCQESVSFPLVNQPSRGVSTRAKTEYHDTRSGQYERGVKKEFSLEDNRVSTRPSTAHMLKACILCHNMTNKPVFGLAQPKHPACTHAICEPCLEKKFQMTREQANKILVCSRCLSACSCKDCASQRVKSKQMSQEDKERCMNVLNIVATHEKGQKFVDMKSTMQGSKYVWLDLDTIKKNLTSGRYLSSVQFANDVRSVWQQCFDSPRLEPVYHQAAIELEEMFEFLLREYVVSGPPAPARPKTDRSALARSKPNLKMKAITAERMTDASEEDTDNDRPARKPKPKQRSDSEKAERRRKSTEPRVRTPKLSAEEKTKLTEAFKLHGKDSEKISQHLGTRSVAEVTLIVRQHMRNLARTAKPRITKTAAPSAPISTSTRVVTTETTTVTTQIVNTGVQAGSLAKPPVSTTSSGSMPMLLEASTSSAKRPAPASSDKQDSRNSGEKSGDGERPSKRAKRTKPELPPPAPPALPNQSARKMDRRQPYKYATTNEEQAGEGLRRQILQVMETKNMSQHGLANMLGIQQAYVSLWLNKKHTQTMEERLTPILLRWVGNANKTASSNNNSNSNATPAKVQESTQKEENRTEQPSLETASTTSIDENME